MADTLYDNGNEGFARRNRGWISAAAAAGLVALLMGPCEGKITKFYDCMTGSFCAEQKTVPTGKTPKKGVVPVKKPTKSAKLKTGPTPTCVQPVQPTAVPESSEDKFGMFYMNSNENRPMGLFESKKLPLYSPDGHDVGTVIDKYVVNAEHKNFNAHSFVDMGWYIPINPDTGKRNDARIFVEGLAGKVDKIYFDGKKESSEMKRGRYLSGKDLERITKIHPELPKNFLIIENKEGKATNGKVYIIYGFDPNMCVKLIPGVNGEVDYGPCPQVFIGGGGVGGVAMFNNTNYGSTIVSRPPQPQPRSTYQRRNLPSGNRP